MAQDWTPQRGVRTGRLWMSHTQADLARELSELTGERWTHGQVQALEAGRKHLTIETMVAIATIQGLPLDFYAYGPTGMMPAAVGDRANPGYRKPDDLDVVSPTLPLDGLDVSGVRQPAPLAA